MAGWSLENIDMVRKQNVARTTLERLSTDLMAVFELGSGQGAVRSELCDAQDAISRVVDRWRAAFEHSKATDRHLAQVTQQLTVAQAKLDHEKSCSRPFEAALPNAWDSVRDQSSFAANSHRIVDVLLHNCTEYFYMQVLGHDGSKRLVFRANISEHFEVVETTGHARHDDIGRLIAKGLSRARGLPEIRFSVNSAVRGFSCASGDDRGSSCRGVSSS